MDHMDQLRLVRGRHHDHVGQGGEIGDVEAAGMSRSVGADQARAVDREADGQVLDRDVMHDLVIGALQEGRVDGAEGPHALRREARGEGDGMLFGDADVEDAVGKDRLELVQPRARRHGGGDGADGGIALRLGDQRLGEDIGVAGRSGGRLVLGAGDDVEFLHAMIFVGRRFGWGIALALLRDDMDQAWALRGIADIFQHRDQLVEIMPVDRPDIIEAQFLEQGAAHRHAARELVGLARRIVERTGQLARQFAGEIAQAQEFAARHQAREIGGEAADRRRDRHVIVVEDDDQPIARVAGIVHRLIGHARRHGAVADHRDCLARLVLHLVGDGEAQRRADRGGAVRRAERVIVAFGALGEAAEAAALAQGADAVAPPGQDLVRIALMADVPDQLVVGRIEHIMDRRGQLHHAQARSQMAAGDADRRDGFGAQFVRQLAQLLGLQLAQVGRPGDLVEQRRLRAIIHGQA